MALVAGVDTSTQSCKVLVVDAGTGAVVRSGRAPHPEGTEVAPTAWETAFLAAADAAGGLDGTGDGAVAAVAVGGQQHGMVCLDDAGDVVRPALLWNDTRSARAALDLTAELGGAAAWAAATGSVPVASFTVTKLRWLAEHEPDAAARTAAVCLPHDWLTWRLGRSTALGHLTTDRGDASGTGYWSPFTGAYVPELLELALGRQPHLPRVLGPSCSPGQTPSGAVLGAGTGDNAAAALGLGAGPGDVVVSIGTSGVASAVSTVAAADPSGVVASFADAGGHFLPLVCTLNAARVLDSTAALLGVDHRELSDLALAAPSGTGGAVLVPWFDGERTPNRPTASASWVGLTHASFERAHLARAAVEGLLCSLADAVDALVAQGAVVERVLLVGGGAASPAVRALAPAVFGRPVHVPPPGEYVALGAARQAAWALGGDDAPPAWDLPGTVVHEADPVPGVRARYAEARETVLERG